MSVFDDDARLVVEMPVGFITPPKRKMVLRNEWTLSLLLPLVMHPFKRGYLGWGKNLYGTPTSVHRCNECNKVFRVTPVRASGNCTALGCSSYEPHNDISWLIKGQNE